MLSVPMSKGGLGKEASENDFICASLHHCFITSAPSCKAELAAPVLVSEQFLTSGKGCLMQVEVLLCSVWVTNSERSLQQELFRYPAARREVVKKTSQTVILM